MSLKEPSTERRAISRIYFDNAATTPIDPQVLEAMLPYLADRFGNPSTIYSYGREGRLAIENARKSVARILNAHPSEIFFTSCGTEASNTAIFGSVRNLGCKHIITSPIEHHATLHPVAYLQHKGEATVSYVKLLSNGHIDLEDLEKLLKQAPAKTLVTLMHANNEIGNITSMAEVGKLCDQYQAIFHSDTVQTVGHYPFNLKNTPVHFISASAHKFHGPKGAGMLYINGNVKIDPYILGGSQERNMRAGTENIYGIVGFAKALEIATEQYHEHSGHIISVRQYMTDSLKAEIGEITFNGDVMGSGLYTILSVNFPKTDKSDMLLFNLDINNICASGGSACTSGATTGSHVINAINGDPNRVTVRFSFSKYNTIAEVEEVVEKLKGMIR